MSELDLIKILAAVVIGGLIGLEREMHSKAAGLRTLTLITIGATLFTVLSERFGGEQPARIAANIVTGVGFLGAGAILLSNGRVKGLTTASSIWVAAAIGMTIGFGEFVLAAVSSVIIVLVLWLFARLDRFIDVVGREIRAYDITYLPTAGKFEEIEKMVLSSGLTVIRKRRQKVGKGLLQGQWETRGALKRHNTFVDVILADTDIVEMKY